MNPTLTRTPTPTGPHTRGLHAACQVRESVTAQNGNYAQAMVDIDTIGLNLARVTTELALMKSD